MSGLTKKITYRISHGPALQILSGSPLRRRTITSKIKTRRPHLASRYQPEVQTLENETDRIHGAEMRQELRSHAVHVPCVDRRL
jgi:hypothetical protein